MMTTMTAMQTSKHHWQTTEMTTTAMKKQRRQLELVTTVTVMTAMQKPQGPVLARESARRTKRQRCTVERRRNRRYQPDTDRRHQPGPEWSWSCQSVHRLHTSKNKS
jgi:hypothetical protein